ncbi:SigF/SigG family RNA polymerase sporulation sigma factor [Clostridia bacterium OttesenSCG-928-F22]|nr:SigF/SigG family RNA polymerase sporulation sigma factor [Clostridia bacterium OttesenSCG-928-F22]
MNAALLPHEETLELLRMAKQGDEYAQDRLVQYNARLVKSLAMKFINRGVDYEELFQIGCIGLIKAIRNYDESYNVRFSTYAVPLITGEIKRFLRDDGYIKISRITKDTGRKIAIAAEELRETLGHDATVKELAEKLETTPEEIAFAMEAMRQPVSLYEPVYDEGGSQVTLMDRIPAQEGQISLDERIMLKEMIGQLEPRERQLIIFRYFKDMTQTQIAQKMGISQVQVSRLENKILGKMREKAE